MVAQMPFPTNPMWGEHYTDPRTGVVYVWDKIRWIQAAVLERKNLMPTKEQLDMHDSLNHAWQEYLVVRKLLGL